MAKKRIIAGNESEVEQESPRPMPPAKEACEYHASEEGGGVHQPTCGECIEAEAAAH